MSRFSTCAQASVPTHIFGRLFPFELRVRPVVIQVFGKVSALIKLTSCSPFSVFSTKLILVSVASI